MDYTQADRSTLERMLSSGHFGAVAAERIRKRIEELDAAASFVVAKPATKTGKLRGEPNQTERRFAIDVLDPMLGQGEILRYEYEAITFHIHGVAKYTPDYVTWLPEGGLWVFEVKGAHIHEKDRIRWKAHSKARPWIRWTMVQWQDQQWKTLYDRHH